MHGALGRRKQRRRGTTPLQAGKSTMDESLKCVMTAMERAEQQIGKLEQKVDRLAGSVQMCMTKSRQSQQMGDTGSWPLAQQLLMAVTFAVVQGLILSYLLKRS